ncbi:MAG: nitronate monooxygenase [Nitrospinota bacterium]|nr:nitronate monooxygenase [Nitrospinota bacterium]
MSFPLVIQGGMGAGVSSWMLAKSVSSYGQLGVVSGTALDVSLLRLLQLGDKEGHIRRALSHFPVPEIAERIINKYFIEGGKPEKEPFKTSSMFTINPGKALLELNIVSNFVEVFLAKEGHNNPVGINYLEKIQMPNLSAIYGAMLAGVDYILMGAGIPREIPGVLDKLAKHEEVSYKINVTGATSEDDFKEVFNPVEILGKTLPGLKRPKFLAIIASAILALTLSRKATGKVDGFIIEGPSAGGHNAPPRGLMQLDDLGEPVYGEKDEVDIEKIKELGYPFWLAGSYGKPEKIEDAKKLGATGVQVGTLFAFCVESGFSPEYKKAVIEKVIKDRATVFTDPVASPTGFPFKVVRLENTVSEEETYLARNRICDLGYLRHIYRKEDGTLGYRCPAEPVDQYLKKGGKVEDTVNRKCLCNALVSNIGLAQLQSNGYVEKGLVTAGDEVNEIKKLLKPGKDTYTAADVLDYLLGK